MKIATVSVAGLLTAATVTSQTVIEQNLQACLEDGQFEIGVDYFPEKYMPTEYAPLFLPADQASLDNTTDFLTIEYFDYYKIVTNKWHNKSYLLYQCGTEPPIEEVNSGRHHLVLPIPHKGGIAVTETPQIPPLELLGLRDEIIAYVGDPQYVSSPCLNYRLDVDGSVEIVFDAEDPWNGTRTQQLSDEFLARHPDVVVFGGIYYDVDAARVMGVAESQERTNVATFDWIAMYAALFNMEAKANIIASETEDRYVCSSSNAQLLSSDLQEEERPTVLWATFFEGYNWSVAECPTWDHTYYCEYARHCGANIISRPEGFGWEDTSFGTSYWYVDDEQLVTLGKDADVFIYASQSWDTIYEEKKEYLDQIKAVRNNQVYDTQGGGQNTWYEQRLAEYDVVANDFCALVGMGNPQQFPPHKIKWFRNVVNGTIPEPEACNVPEELDDPYVPVGAFCAPLAQPSGGESGVEALLPVSNLALVAVALVAIKLW